MKTIASKLKYAFAGAVLAAVAVVPAVSATPLIENDSLDGLSEAGTEISGFMANIAPGIFKILLLLGLAVAIVGLVTACIGLVRRGFGRK